MAPRKRARTAAAPTDPDAPAPIVLSGGAALPPAIVDLWNEGALCDAEIVAGGRAFSAHKLVLVGGIAYMSGRLRVGDRYKDSSGPIDLQDMSSAALEAALGWLYSGTCTVPGDGVLLGEVLRAAARLQVVPLQEAAVVALVERLAPTNALSMWAEADRLSLPALGEAARSTAAAGFAEVAAHEAFVAAPPERVIALLGDDRLDVPEAAVFGAAQRYVHARPSTPSAEEAAAVFAPVRFKLLDSAFVRERVLPEPLLQTVAGLRLVAEAQNAAPGAVVARTGGGPRSVYVLGGWGASGGRLSSVVRFDAADGAWHGAPAMAAARSSACAAVLDGLVYIAGGRDGSGMPLASVERFSAARGAWEAVAPMVTARSACAAAAVGGKLYVMGGVGASVSLSTVECYDPERNEWRAVAPMAGARNSQACAVLDGKIYVAGGFNSGSGLSIVECYDPERDEWQAVAPLRAARYQHGLAALGGKLYVAGGYGTTTLGSVECFDPARGTWEAVAPMRTARRFFVAAAIGGKMYAIGGKGAASLDSVECYDPARDEWSEGAPLPAGRWGGGGAA